MAYVLQSAVPGNPASVCKAMEDFGARAGVCVCVLTGPAGLRDGVIARCASERYCAEMMLRTSRALQAHGVSVTQGGDKELTSSDVLCASPC